MVKGIIHPKLKIKRFTALWHTSFIYTLHTILRVFQECILQNKLCLVDCWKNISLEYIILYHVFLKRPTSDIKYHMPQKGWKSKDGNRKYFNKGTRFYILPWKITINIKCVYNNFPGFLPCCCFKYTHHE